MQWGKNLNTGTGTIELTKEESEALENRKAVSKVIMSAHGEFTLEVKLTRRKDQSRFTEMNGQAPLPIRKV